MTELVESACPEGAKPWGPILALQLGMAAYTCKPSVLEIEAGGSEVHRYPLLQIEHEASLGYMRTLSLK